MAEQRERICDGDSEHDPIFVKCGCHRQWWCGRGRDVPSQSAMLPPSTWQGAAMVGGVGRSGASAVEAGERVRQPPGPAITPGDHATTLRHGHALRCGSILPDMVERKGDIPNLKFRQLVPRGSPAKFCRVCGRKLRSKRSIRLGVGPVCARRA
ncbi:hypothetical protein Vse01_42180 [Micromonospora sediminimaris]|uniref:Uncharacterized protein n=2 Tax=Micromonospora sediminimaris TaxID=547162 RepID=A0A9W5UX74_9ACTN|nr:hypothetical protein Vse01_42180 [Micromonospora sediminimaris]